MKIPTEIGVQLLPTTASGFDSSVHEKGVAGHHTRYSQDKKLFEVEVEL